MAPSQFYLFFICVCECLTLQSLKSTFCLLHKDLLLSVVLQISDTQDADTPDVKVYETLTTAVTCWMDFNLFKIIFRREYNQNLFDLIEA